MAAAGAIEERPFKHGAVVKVDLAFASVAVVDYVVVHDCGTIVNPAIVEGQIARGAAQRIGAALLEELAYEPDGGVHAGLTEYLIPTAVELPAVGVTHDESPAGTRRLPRRRGEWNPRCARRDGWSRLGRSRLPCRIQRLR